MALAASLRSGEAEAVPGYLGQRLIQAQIYRRSRVETLFVLEFKTASKGLFPARYVDARATQITCPACPSGPNAGASGGPSPDALTMASPSGPSQPVSVGEPGGTRESIDSDSEGSYSEGSYSSSDALQSSPLPCQWRTSEFHDQECSRFVDCPSHILRRQTSPQDADPGLSSSGGGPSTMSAAPDANHDASRHMSDSDAEVPNSERMTDNQFHRDAGAASFGIASLTRTHDDEPTALPIRTSSVVRRADDASQRGPGRSLPTESSASFLDTRQAGERHRAAHGGRSSPESPTRESELQSNHGAAAVHEDHAPTQGTTHETQARGDDSGSTPEFVLPRWQPDAEVTYCPICHTQFSIFVRKHHCRKCGRVVCNSCSLHRIIIPYQYIVRPPGSEISMPPSLLLDGLGAGYFDVNGPSGEERVRLCNPCVPDPNTAPPQSPTPSTGPLPHQRSRSSLGGEYGVAHAANTYGAMLTAGRGGDAYRYYSPRWRSITMGPPAAAGTAGSSLHHRVSATYRPPLDRFLAVGPSSASSSSRRHRYGSFADAAVPSSPSSSRHRALPPPIIAEEDECPTCHRELPSRELPDFERLRESHITMCIQTHSTYGSPQTGPRDTAAPPAPRRTGMYTYAATEKDCIDDAECTICLEEFTVGVPMARLECLCRFHKACISAWFVNHPGRCPVHQHDGFGF